MATIGDVYKGAAVISGSIVEIQDRVRKHRDLVRQHLANLDEIIGDSMASPASHMIENAPLDHEQGRMVGAERAMPVKG